MRIIAIKTLKDFWTNNKYKDSEQSLKSWYQEVKKSKWSSSADIKHQYKSASIINNNRVVFNIKGNKYRLIITIKYDFNLIYIRFIGTHKQYDKIIAEEV